MSASHRERNVKKATCEHQDKSTAHWPAQLAPLVGMGGCAAIPTLKSNGLMCDTDMGTNSFLQQTAPGATGTLCDYCAASCKNYGDVCKCEAFVFESSAL